MEDYVTFDQAKSLKDLGFDWECTHYYWEKSESLQEYLAKNIDMYHNSWDFNYTEYIDDYTIPGGKHFRENRFEDAYSAPTLSQVQKWLFEQHGHFLSIQYNSETENFQCVIYKQTFTQGYYHTNESYTKQYFQGCEDIISYDPTICLSKGIDKVLELLK